MRWFVAVTFALVSTLHSMTVLGATLVPSPPSIKAKSFLLEDYASGKVLASHNIDERMEPASLTKLMTTYVVLGEIEAGAISLNDMVRISPRARSMEGSRMFVEVDSLVSVKDLLLGVIVQSGNDASVALAESVAGDESAFSSLMNQYAARIGMSGSQFRNASGLPHPEHYTTARDMATIARALIRDFSQHYHLHAIREFEHNGIKQPNRNRLLHLDSRVDGLKTGYTRLAGYCIVISGKQDNMRLITVVMGAASEKARVRQAQALLSYGFRFYETHRLYEARQSLTKPRIWKGAMQKMDLGLSQDLFVTVPRGKLKSLHAEMELPAQVFAPIRAGEQKGELRVSLGKEVVARRPLIALHAVAQGNVWQRVSDHVRLMFE